MPSKGVQSCFLLKLVPQCNECHMPLEALLREVETAPLLLDFRVALKGVTAWSSTLPFRVKLHRHDRY